MPPDAPTTLPEDGYLEVQVGDRAAVRIDLYLANDLFLDAHRELTEDSPLAAFHRANLAVCDQLGLTGLSARAAAQVRAKVFEAVGAILGKGASPVSAS